MIALFIYLFIETKLKSINLTSDFEIYSKVDFGFRINLEWKKSNGNFSENILPNFYDLYSLDIHTRFEEKRWKKDVKNVKKKNRKFEIIISLPCILRLGVFNL